MNRVLLIVITFFFAALLTILPLPQWLAWLWPEWLILILLYWTIKAPYHVNIGVAFVIGIVADLLHGNILGENALLFVILIYAVNKFSPRLRMWSMWQQMFLVLILSLAYQLASYLLQNRLSHDPTIWLYNLSALTSALLWPLLSVILDKCQPYTRINLF